MYACFYIICIVNNDKEPSPLLRPEISKLAVPSGSNLFGIREYKPVQNRYGYF